MDKGEDVMRIAVTYENGDIYQHFGHTERFKIYDVQDGKVMDSRIIDTNGQGHGALADILRSLHADILICGRRPECTEGGCPDLRRYWWRCPDGTERCGYPALWWCFRQR